MSLKTHPNSLFNDNFPSDTCAFREFVNLARENASEISNLMTPHICSPNALFPTLKPKNSKIVDNYKNHFNDLEN